jgi:hypothetical protein
MNSFLNMKNSPLAKIRQQPVTMYGEGVMNKGNVHKWCQLFNERADVYNEEQFGFLSPFTTLTQKNLCQMSEEVKELHIG